MWLSAVVIDWVIKKQKAWADNNWMVDWPVVKEKAVQYISVVSMKARKQVMNVQRPTHRAIIYP